MKQRDAYLGSGIVGQSASFFYTPPSDSLTPPCIFCIENFVGFSIYTVPEPSTVAIMILGGLAAYLIVRRRMCLR
jgi:hypothetical protein